MFDIMFGEALEDLDKAEQAIMGYQSPFVKGEDLDINNEELVQELTEYAFHAPIPQKEK